MSRKSEQSKETYDKMALEYDSSQEGNYTRTHKAELIKNVLVKDGYTILDVACGNGFLLAELSKKAKVNANGIDISPNMISVAKKRYPNCTFILQPSFPLDFESKSQDIITVSCAFHHFDNPQGFADETSVAYCYIDKFVDMISSEKYVIRVRGFLIFCRQAKWDKNLILDDNIDIALNSLNDEKPTTVRQALAAVGDVVRYKPD